MSTETPVNNSSHYPFLLLLLLVGTLLRILSGMGNLWLDEVWNINLASSIQNPVEIYSNRGFDGHSSLFSIFLFYLGKGYGDFTYRILSVLFSIGTLLVFIWGKPFKGSKNSIYITLVVFSFPFILYGTEARGYSGMLFFCSVSLCSLIKLQQEKVKPHLLSFLFSTGTILAFLFHYSFIFFYYGVFLWFLIMSVRKKQKHFLHLATSHLFINLAIALVYILVISKLGNGSGPKPPYLDTFIQTLSLFSGALPISIFHQYSLGLSFLLASIAIYVIWKECNVLFQESNDLWILFALSALVCPLVIVMILQPEIIYPRYFLAPGMVFLVILASFISRQLRSNQIYARVCGLSLLAIYISGNSLNIYKLVNLNRGNYEEILSFITCRGKLCNVVVDHYFRHQMMIEYYTSTNRRPVLTDYDDTKQGIQYDWYLLHSLDWGFIPRKEIKLLNGQSMRLHQQVRSTALSGWSTFIYKSVTPPVVLHDPGEGNLRVPIDK